ncbi:MAG: SemiSWEET transporter [Thermoflavifilum sp.]|jgi:MtN3 and saliva related transmembrane protein|uniref:SemiSWEET transporter n=1 Tax=Thermoflavifilum sp. TaxID=1968839 RepID=UPI0018A69849|nr:SemiSWEET transporter [Thermoflavifilum sp.]QOR75184.1 MAG: SemiSWEET transporter [Thermoflavifilum sp.]
MNLVIIIGLIAACCTTISFIPQAIQTIRSRNTRDISLGMYVLFTTGTLLWLIYGIFSHSLPVALANAVTLVFAGIILIYKIKYH